MQPRKASSELPMAAEPHRLAGQITAYFNRVRPKPGKRFCPEDFTKPHCNMDRFNKSTHYPELFKPFKSSFFSALTLQLLLSTASAFLFAFVTQEKHLSFFGQNKFFMSQIQLMLALLGQGTLQTTSNDQQVSPLT